jgi:1-deoxy-D-xylulose-5-phosphate reductoisomerase
LQTGGAAAVILNAANEVAVAAFLAGRIGFPEIVAIVEEALTRLPNGAIVTLEDVMAADQRARRLALELAGGVN